MHKMNFMFLARVVIINLVALLYLTLQSSSNLVQLFDKTVEFVHSQVSLFLGTIFNRNFWSHYVSSNSTSISNT